MAGWIIKTDGGRWKARLSITGAGTRNKTFDRKIDAEKWLRSEQARLDRSEWTDPRLARTTFADWAIPWLDTRRHLKPKTLDGYQSLLSVHLLPRFGQLPLGAIDPLMIETWVVDLTDSGLSASRTRQAHQLLSMTLKAAVRARHLTSNPADGTPLPRAVRRAPRFLSANQVDDLADLVSRRYRGLVYVLAYGGLRWAEAVGLKLEHVNLLRRRIAVRETLSEVRGEFHTVPPKTWETRTVAIPPFVADILGEHIGRFAGDSKDGRLFVTDNDTPLRSSNFRRWVWMPSVAALRQEGLRIHDLRHTCASMLIAAGAHPGHVREHLGHSSIRVTMDVYGHLYEDTKDEIADRLQRHRSR
ncbi:MAG: site-specific integrase [Acidimicrobiia bacterium]|nr:site-specific integrase [Acidimicrobiia bacterium]